jgi:hypothetical protein
LDECFVEQQDGVSPPCPGVERVMRPRVWAGRKKLRKIAWKATRKRVRMGLLLATG